MRVDLRPEARRDVVTAEAPPNRRLGFLGMVVLPLVLLGVAWATTPHTELNGGLETDGVYYLAMAERGSVDPVLSHTSPMAYRVLTPWLTNAVPGSGLTPFSVLAFASGWATLALLYSVLRRSGVSQRGSIAGLLLYSGVFWSLKYSFFSPALVDFQTQLFLVGICYLMLRRWWWAIPGVVALGVAQKESILAMALVVFAYRVTTVRASAVRQLAYLGALIVPGVAVYAGLRSAITPLKSYPSGVGLMISQAGFWAHPDRWPVLLLCLFSGLGALPLLVAALRRDVAARVKENLHWLVMIAVGVVLLLGGLAKSRLFLYMLPAVVVLVAQALDRRLHDARRTAWAALAAVIAAHFAFGSWLNPVDSYETYLRYLNPEFSLSLGAAPYVRTIAMIAAAAAGLVAFTKRGPASPSLPPS